MLRVVLVEVEEGGKGGIGKLWEEEGVDACCCDKCLSWQDR